MRIAISNNIQPGEAAKAAGAALSEMEALSIAPTPVNYAVWFQYKLGEPAALVQDMIALVNSKRPISAEDHLALYERHLDSEPLSDSVVDAADRVDDSIAHVMELLRSAAGDARSFSQTLKSSEESLAGDLTLEAVRNVVENLSRETATLRERNEELSGKLQNASTEVLHLKENLEEAREEALLDGLTGVANRKAFDANLRQATRAAEEEGAPLSLLMVDIDHFKRFNDTFGHAMGDQVLKLVGHILHQSLKGQDKAARYGGEEFAVILPRTRLGDAARVAESLRKTLCSKKIMRKSTGEELARITMSVGVAQYRLKDTIEGFLGRADRALYQAKNSGRNKVVKESSVEATDADHRIAS